VLLRLRHAFHYGLRYIGRMTGSFARDLGLEPRTTPETLAVEPLPARSGAFTGKCTGCSGNIAEFQPSPTFEAAFPRRSWLTCQFLFRASGAA
jgi:hypothetical protein